MGLMTSDVWAMVEPWLVVAGFAAGLVNAIAGGGPLLTLAALTAAGLDPRTANLKERKDQLIVTIEHVASLDKARAVMGEVSD